MSFEDYMMDDGFSDSQEYMSYLEDKALDAMCGDYRDYDFNDDNFVEVTDDLI